MSTKRATYLHIAIGAEGPKVSGATYARYGQCDLPKTLQSAQDVFAEWSWNGNTVVVRNCRLGFYPLYYFATDQEFGVSPSIEQLLACGAPRDIDDAAMATFLRFGWVMGDDTVFKNIRLLKPNGEIRWSGKERHVSGGYTFPKHQDISRQEAIDSYIDLFRQAIKRRASDQVSFAIPLSGGRDSRHILLELAAQGRKPERCFTNHDFPPVRKGDIEVATQLTQKLDVPHTLLGQRGSRFAAETKKNQLNNFCAIENIQMVNLFPSIAQYEQVVYEGIAGDVLSAGLYLEKAHVRLFEQGRIEELAENLTDRWVNWRSSEGTLSRILTKDANKRFTRELAVERIARELVKHCNAANPVSSFHFWNRTRRATALQPFSIAAQAGVTAITPFLDHDLIDFLSSLPAEMFIDKNFHTETIDRAYPEFSNIPYASGDQLIKENNLHFRRLFFRIGTYLLSNGQNLFVQRSNSSRRLLALALSGGNLRKRMNWISPFLVLYLAQLETLYSRKSE